MSTIAHIVAAVDHAFEDASYPWQTGYFQGKAVFTALDPGEFKVATLGELPPSLWLLRTVK